MALNIADLFEHAVDAVPDNPAIKVGDRVVTYAELEADSNRLAHFLSSRGVHAGQHVGLYAKNSVGSRSHADEPAAVNGRASRPGRLTVPLW